MVDDVAGKWQWMPSIIVWKLKVKEMEALLCKILFNLVMSME